MWNLAITVLNYAGDDSGKVPGYEDHEVMITLYATKDSGKGLAINTV